jgi:twitching motility protein PilT
MLGWMKDVMGRKVSPLQVLAQNQYKDDTEKQALLSAIATDESIKAEELIPVLSLPDPQVQQRIGALFVTRANEAGVTALVYGAADMDQETRTMAIKVLSRVRPDLLMPAIDGSLSVKKANAEAMKNAWEVAMEMPSEVSDKYLDRALKEGPPRARFNALTRFIKTKPADEIRAQLILSSADREARVRKLAVETLVTLQGSDIFEALIDRLSGEDNPEIRTAAGAYLQKYIASAPAELRPTILGRLLLSGDSNLQATLLKALFAVGNNVNEQLLEILTFCKTILGAQHLSVTEALKTLGDPVLDATLKLLNHTDPDIRVQALLLIERYADPRTSGTIVKLLGDADWWVRIMACETLGRIKDARVIDHLTRMLPDPDVKWAAIDAIGNIGGESAFAALVGLLKDAKPEVRLAAINGLKKIEDSRVDGYITDISKNDASMDVRVRAVEIMRERGAAGSKGGAAITSAQLQRPIEKLLAFARESGASDLHISPTEPPFLRVNGILSRIEMKPLSPQQTEAFLADVLDSVRRPILEKTGAVDLCYSIPGVGRYRVNVFSQKRGLSAVFRCIPNVAPTLAELGLPRHLDEVNTYHQGIVLLTGPAGSGKSTSLTALVNVVNENRKAHVLSLEDPIEFLHSPKMALVNQREIGRDSRSFAASMRAALREDPDIVVVGEMRDAETIRLALVASETGHLVIATMQTTGAVATIDKLVESFPTDEQQQIRVSSTCRWKRSNGRLRNSEIDVADSKHHS